MLRLAAIRILRNRRNILLQNRYVSLAKLMFIVFYERKLKLRGMFFKRALRAFEIVHVFFVFIRLVFAYHCGIVVFILFPFLICFVLFLCSYRFEKCFSSRQQRGHGGGPDVRIPGAES